MLSYHTPWRVLQNPAGAPVCFTLAIITCLTQELHTVYRGADTSFLLKKLACGTRYTARVKVGHAGAGWDDSAPGWQGVGVSLAGAQPPHLAL